MILKSTITIPNISDNIMPNAKLYTYFKKLFPFRLSFDFCQELANNAVGNNLQNQNSKMFSQNVKFSSIDIYKYLCTLI